MKTIIIPEDKEGFSCRFHPTDWFHEIGCPHMRWSKKQLEQAIKTSEPEWRKERLRKLLSQ